MADQTGVYMSIITCEDWFLVAGPEEKNPKGHGILKAMSMSHMSTTVFSKETLVYHDVADYRRLDMFG